MKKYFSYCLVIILMFVSSISAYESIYVIDKSFFTRKKFENPASFIKKALQYDLNYAKKITFLSFSKDGKVLEINSLQDWDKIVTSVSFSGFVNHIPLLKRINEIAKLKQCNIAFSIYLGKCIQDEDEIILQKLNNLKKILKKKKFQYSFYIHPINNRIFFYETFKILSSLKNIKIRDRAWMAPKFNIITSPFAPIKVKTTGLNEFCVAKKNDHLKLKIKISPFLLLQELSLIRSGFPAMEVGKLKLNSLEKLYDVHFKPKSKQNTFQLTLKCSKPEAEVVIETDYPNIEIKYIKSDVYMKYVWENIVILITGSVIILLSIWYKTKQENIVSNIVAVTRPWNV